MRIFSVLFGQDSNIEWLWGGRNVSADLGMTPRFLAWVCVVIEVSNTEEVKVREEKTISSLGMLKLRQL